MFELKKIGIVKRASAWLLDAILLSVLATGFIWIISLICHFEAEADLLEEYTAEQYAFQKEYIPGIAARYGFDYVATYSDDDTYDIDYTLSKDGKPLDDLMDVTDALVGEIATFCGFTFTREDKTVAYLKGPDGQNATLEELLTALRASEDKPESAEAFEHYVAILPALSGFDRQYEYVNTILFMMVSVGTLLAYLILEFIVPLCLKNGQTVGKKVFSIALVRPDCVRITPLPLFGRVVIGKFAIETMFPILLIFLFFYAQLGLLALILLGALLLLNIILFFATKNHTPIHDVLAYTVAVDMKEQMIYDSEEELNRKKAELHKAEVESQKSN